MTADRVPIAEGQTGYELPAMTEDELVTGLLDAFGIAGWSAWHVRRSDRAIWMGTPGWPDITACPPNPGPMLVLEAKSATGRVSGAQATWLVQCHQRGITAAVLRPADYDRALKLILSVDSSPEAWAWAFKP